MKEFNKAKTAENLEKILFKSLSDFGLPFETLVDHCLADSLLRLDVYFSFSVLVITKFCFWCMCFGHICLSFISKFVL